MPGDDRASPWYVHAFNRAGALAAAAGLRSDEPFTPARLCAAAMRRAGGLSDWGTPDVEAPLTMLCESFRGEAFASQTGRVAMREHLLELLTGRLRLAVAASAHDGAVAAEPLPRPVFVFGLPRTGTTLLHNLIAQDPGVRVPWTWEVMMPTPQPGATLPAARRAAVARRLQWVHRLAPAFRSVHAVAADLPQECIAITAYALQSIEFHTTHCLPSYQDWFEGSDQSAAYAFHRCFLQHLQHEDRRTAGVAGAPFTPRRWVLKAPGHLFGMDALIGAYPDAVLVQTHRDPLEVVGSISSHGVILRRAFSDRVDEREVAQDWSARWSRALDRTLHWRAANPATDRQVLDVQYRDTVADPLGTVGRIYEHAGLDLTADARERMHAFLQANPQGRHGRHRYTLEQFGLDPAHERERFAAYRRWLNL